MWFLVVSYGGREYFCCSFHKSFFAGRESSKRLSQLDMLQNATPGSTDSWKAGNWIWIELMLVFPINKKNKKHIPLLLLVVQKSGVHQLRLVVYPIIYKVLYIPGGCLGFLPSTAMLVYQKRFPVTTKERFFITIGEKSLQFLRAISTRQMLTSLDCFLGLYGFTRQQQERPTKFVDGGFLPKYLVYPFSGIRW